MKKIFRYLLAFTLLLSFDFTLISATNNQTSIFVNNSATFEGTADGSLERPFSTIQTAINYVTHNFNQNNEYEIIVSPGYYFESVVISNLSNITITGSGQGETIVGPDRAYDITNSGFVIDNANNIMIQNLTIDGFSNPAFLGSTFRDGIRYTDNGGNHNTFRNLEIKNIDRRGISVWPEANVGTLIENNHIYNITGNVMGSWSGAIGIVMNGLGTIKNNILEEIHTGIIANASGTFGEIIIENNILRNFKTENVSLNTGISLWPKSRQRVIVRNNVVTSEAEKQVGMYLNASWDSESIVEGNTITLTGKYSIGLDVLNHMNSSGGYTIHNNTIEVAKYSTGIALSNVGTSPANPMIISNNSITNSGDDDDFENNYSFNFVFNRADVGREVAILISTSVLTKRVMDTDSTRTYINLLSNTIDGFKESIVYLKDRNDLGSFEDISILNNRIRNFERDLRFGVIESSNGTINFENLDIATTFKDTFLDHNHFEARIDFNTNVTGLSLSSIIGFDGDAVSLPQPTRTGFSFKGWFDESLTNQFQSTTLPRGVTTLFAQWQINTYTVTFKDYDNTIIGTPQIIEHGTPAIAPVSPTRQGFIFIGWDVSFANITSDLTIKALYQSIPQSDVIIGSDELPNFLVEGLEDLDRLGITFTPEELQQRTSVLIEFSILDRDDLSDFERNLLDDFILNVLSFNQPVKFLIDVSMFRVVGDTASSITNLNAPITISFELPIGFRGISFTLLRVHDGEVESLDFEYDEETFILRFTTDKFSTYALVGVEEAEEIPQTSDSNTSSFAWSSLILGLLLVLVGSKKNKQQVSL